MADPRTTRLSTLSPEAKRYIIETTVRRVRDEPGIAFRQIFEETVAMALLLFGDPTSTSPRLQGVIRG